ncbi:MAG: hypothetical protein HYY78_04885 [Betaproteobacteria bacterium]|nr:hypothetical protein [Betaproteobacteria bacterium]
MHKLAPFELQLFEQPAHRNDLAGLARVRHEGGVPVMADESIMDDASLIAVIKAEAADIVKLKSTASMWQPAADSSDESVNRDKVVSARFPNRGMWPSPEQRSRRPVLPSRDSARRSTSADRHAVARVAASACHVLAYGSRRDPNPKLP